MFDNFFTNSAIKVYERAMDGSVLRQQVITNNIANVDTPGYKAADVSFEKELQNAIKGTGTSMELRSTHRNHIQIFGQSSAPFKVSADDTSLRNDENNVDIDREIANLTSNEIYYDAVSRSLNDEFRLLNLVIKGTGD